MGRHTLVSLWFITAVLGGPGLQLKTRTIDTSSLGPLSRPPQGCSHHLVQFDHQPGAEDVVVLARRGVAVLGYVHENGAIVCSNDDGQLEGLGIAWAGRFDAADKLSPLLVQPRTTETVVVEFHQDVDMNDARRMTLDSGAVLLDRPDLAAHHLLVSATREQLFELAGLDAVVYLFPASEQLASGRPVSACAGALTALGSTVQSVPVMGNGWDGPGNGAATLFYYFSQLTTQVPAGTVQSEVVRAFHEWSKYAKLTFLAGTAAGAERTINVLFATRTHGDGYPFDGVGGVLAHTFYPAGINPEPLAGDMHFDDDEPWHVGVDKDLFSVALHETGHALGLGHADDPTAIMYPYYSQATTLSDLDIRAIRSLYATQDPANATAASAPSSTPSAPLKLTATAPSLVTAAVLTVKGTLTGGEAPVAVVWKTDHRQSGTARGSAEWSAEIPLSIGANTITVSAVDMQKNMTTATIVVRREAPGRIATPGTGIPHLPRQ